MSGSGMRKHEPLSEQLAALASPDGNGGELTLNDLLVKTEGRGLYLVIILLSLPFILPVSIPGMSVVFGPAVCLLSLRLAFGQSPRLPGFIGNRRLSASFRDHVLGGGAKFLKLVERFVRPRRTQWLSTRAARLFNGLLLTFMALLLTLPFPPLPPLTNALPCYSIILLAAAMMEEDGVLIWIAYGFCLGTTIYLGLVLEVIEVAVVRVWHTVHLWLVR